MTATDKMTSNRPYLVRAMYDWICDNGLTPYLLVDARQNGVRVPRHAVKDGQIVLNVAVRAVSDLELGNDRIHFHARFGGVSQQVDVPVLAVLAIYAQENGQGMMFPVEAGDDAPPPSDEPVAEDKPVRKGPGLRIVK
ncbi:MAG TPA: ClpXP protease specificity-enhancing factor [Patescibacteria group bacterium]|nr:ClpXP protease specificity-enhancing factor [Patescibacteria group bacterium]